jgi:hypothetical protein
MSDERLFNSLALGFDLALYAGPLCEEPIVGKIINVSLFNINRSLFYCRGYLI